MTALRQRMIDDMRLRNFSAQTGPTSATSRLSRSTSTNRPSIWVPEQARAFSLHLVDRGLSPSTVNLARCAIRFVEHVTLGREWSTPYIASGARRASTGFRSCSHPPRSSACSTRSSNLKYRTILATICDRDAVIGGDAPACQ
ncbi:MAG: phage integrase N-terminal SAM-like domain-containing protein [Blastocatellia bacterium]|nr:phage integrase N-terminal SAM-like domain-containing protein [Blastocatellia bacterium]